VTFFKKNFDGLGKGIVCEVVFDGCISSLCEFEFCFMAFVNYVDRTFDRLAFMGKFF
jgi:hypothetical protein